MVEQNYTNILVELSNKIGQLDEALKGLKLHFENHLHLHYRRDWFMLIQTVIIISLFCFLRWR